MAGGLDMVWQVPKALDCRCPRHWLAGAQDTGFQVPRTLVSVVRYRGLKRLVGRWSRPQLAGSKGLVAKDPEALIDGCLTL